MKEGYFWIAENVEKIISLASGATFKEINKTTFRKLPILLADRDTKYHFVEILNPICKQIENLQNKNTNLRRTRDLLLSKLISGEIDVEDLDIETGIMNDSEEVSSSSQKAIAGWVGLKISRRSQCEKSKITVTGSKWIMTQAIAKEDK